jgi:gluconate 2-dehydrogenase gamma chain
MNHTKKEKKTDYEAEKPHLLRRDFLKLTGVFIATASTLSGCEVDPESPTVQPFTQGTGASPITKQQPTAVAGQYEEVPYTPTEPPQPGVLRFFSLHEAQTVEDLTAHILPGSPEDPGAREAGVVTYIDNLLSHEHGFAQPIYRQPPFAEPYTGQNPPEQGGRTAGYQTVWVHRDELPRYGYQSALTPREIYRRGLELVDRYCRDSFGSSFIKLSESQQESVVSDMADGKVTPSPGQEGGGGSSSASQTRGGGESGDEETGFYPPSLEDFFTVLRTHTIEGMFSDPLYGGNRNLAGWKLLGYPGAQRAYTPLDIRTEGTDREPQSIAQLPHFNPGQRANDDVILPVSGTDQQHSH